MPSDILPADFETYGADEKIPVDSLPTAPETPPFSASFSDESSNLFIGRYLTRENLLPYLQAQKKPEREITTLHIHHTWSPTPSQWWGYSTLKGVADYYHNTNGWTWGKIPTFWVAQESHGGPWGIWVATHPYYASIHCPGFNTHGYGVEVCWNGNEKSFTQEQKELLAHLIYCLNIVYGIPMQHSHRSQKTVPGIRIHRYDYSTDCPGYKNVDSMVDNVLSLISTTKTLKKGDTGTEVSQLQQKLKNAGYRLDITGTFDNRTEALVKSLQSSKLIDNGGVVDAATWTAFTKPDRMLKWKDPYMSGMDVTWIQRILQRQGYYKEPIKDVFNNRVFDGKTFEAVKQFQIACDIEADGIVGDVTWNQLRKWSN